MSEREGAGSSERPCRFCRAAYGDDADLCEFAHQDMSPNLTALASEMARVFQQEDPTDEQVGWFMEDADAVVSDFDPAPERWKIRKLPLSEYGEFVARFRINEVTYVIEDGEGHCAPVRLSTYREWQHEADAAGDER